MNSKTATKAATRSKAKPAGILTVVGKVTVNGKPAATGDVIKSGSTTSTAAKSSSVVSIGKLGRVEVSESSTAKISFTASRISSALDHGRVKITAAKRMAANISIKGGEVDARSRK